MSSSNFHHWFFHANISLNAMFQLFIPISGGIINIWPVLDIFGSQGNPVTSYHRINFQNISKNGNRHWIPHAKINPHAKFLLFIPSSWGIMNILPILDKFGPHGWTVGKILQLISKLHLPWQIAWAHECNLLNDFIFLPIAQTSSLLVYWYNYICIVYSHLIWIPMFSNIPFNSPI